jgi:Na+/H+ antiporter NhaD/arsenite permease-like protein
MTGLLLATASALAAFAGDAPAALAAADPGHFDGAQLGLAWTIPFAGILLSIALCPLLAPRLWEHRFGTISGLWAASFLVPFAVTFGLDTAFDAMLHTLLLEYLPFIILLFSLFVVAGGICVRGNLVGTPQTNTAMLTFGSLIASLLGTTGASMLLIRPMIRANQHRRHKVHVFVFFIFLVSNIGGALTPLGDPPLFLGFLKGVDFFWTAQHMFVPTLAVGAVLLGVFYLVDRWAWRREAAIPVSKAPRQIGLEGLPNILYLAGIIAAVLISGLWQPGIAVSVSGIDVPLQGLARDAALLVISYLSWKTTKPALRVENAFTWLPIREVAVLFAGIFLTIIPALAILRAGQSGALAGLVALVTDADGSPNEAAYFWLTGGLSSFLDNAPTYLVFFNLAGGDPAVLMGPLAQTLVAISAGAVFMGANTYIGNAPNFMVKAICQERGIRMPSFFGYMLWSAAILLPVFLLVSWLFFR